MSKQSFIAPKLPKELLDKVDPGASASSRRKGLPRKEQRKFERQQKKTKRHQPRSYHNNDHDEVIADPWGGDEEPPKKRARVSQTPSAKSEKPKPILKKKVIMQKEEEEEEEDEYVAPRPSKAVRDALEDDDAEIAFLEKKLGLKGKKRSKAIDEDGLGELLNGIDEAVSGEKKNTQTEDEEWLAAKRRRAAGEEEDSGSDKDMDSDEDELGIFSDEDEDVIDHDEDLDGGDDEEIEDPFGGSESEEELPQEKAPRENPYRAPVSTSTTPSQKYIPPSLRAPAKDEQEILQRLRRQLQGLLNRLSESNILSILKEIEGVLSSNPRQHVISTLIDLLIGLVTDRTSHLDTFIILHAGFISGIYGVIGTHFGAQVLERVVKEFHHHYNQQITNPDGSKETSNLIALLAELYTFQVISHNLIFDFIRFLLSDLSELNTELLLKLIKNCGPQLRVDDPLALKDIVMLVQKAAAKKGGDTQLSVRTKFMIETISNLKNNRMKTGLTGSTMTSEHVLRLKKTIKSRNLRTMEPLGIGLKDVENADKGGKWWLVGASWKNDESSKDNLSNDPEPLDELDNGKEKEDDYFANDSTDGSSVNLLALAKQHRMNTDVRRSIFVTLMSSVDYKDAWLRLRRLKMSKTQQFEIPRVLVYLAGAEDNYNPYYRLVAKKFCTEHKFRKALQFNMWRIFRRCGEKDDLADDDDEDGGGEEQDGGDIQLREIVSLARFFGELIAGESLPITMLKVCVSSFPSS
jgi:nucleolar MIF4G domain-containing protein 1